MRTYRLEHTHLVSLVLFRTKAERRLPRELLRTDI